MIRNFFGKFRSILFRPQSAPAGNSDSDLSENTSEESAIGMYSSDQPISSTEQDLFDRSQFSQRIAEVLANHRDPSSMIIGIYGQWGSGKTSVLNLMTKKLETHNDIVIVRFNPWHFETEDSLVRWFFGTLAQSLGKSISSASEQLGEALKQYAALLSLATISVGGFVKIDAAGAAKGVGETLSTVKLEELRSRVENILRDSGTRIVVLIDDIDRLDRREIQAIFRLVRLSASFEYTSYVLAFDDEMVAAALGEKYGEGNARAGRSFLEKIVQVPLHLPPPDALSLRKLAFRGVDEALRLAEIELTEEIENQFTYRFVEGIEPRLRTARQAKLYANALMFALPILKGEVNPLDQMLVEGIRLFYPELYLGSGPIKQLAERIEG